MPIYGFQCQSCNHEFEVMQKISDPAPSACPACGAAEVRKQLNAAGFQLKGNGWYATDFKGGNRPASEKAAEPAPAGGCGSGACGACAL